MGGDRLRALQEGLILITQRLDVLITKLCTTHGYKNILRFKTTQATQLSFIRRSLRATSHSSRVHKRASVAIVHELNMRKDDIGPSTVIEKELHNLMTMTPAPGPLEFTQRHGRNRSEERRVGKD